MEIKLRSTFAVGSTSHLEKFGPGKGPVNLKIDSGTTVRQLLEILPSIGPPDQFDDIMIHVFVNGKLCGFDHVLKPGDTVDIHIPVSGG